MGASSPPSDRHRHPIANHQRTANFDLGSVTGEEPRLEPTREQRPENVRFEHDRAVHGAPETTDAGVGGSGSVSSSARIQA
jgi:hypothetical protein